ncbi:uracil-DNA glycosylase [Mesorhizobium sp. M0924]|uniref:uracil-DNA glycosylase n=1 Tax=unclassified Mesorhizobium TaxID=325217 RepID=UPI0003CF1060|nr:MULTISPECIES: uracil-DNA glycosylase [unclassified Mesorhizobium]ESY25232.1 SPO1 DNA polymerase [Mesorhizobium sp. LNJC394B00]ESZ70180.1 SPO1 DNA polymerase [Mesorhizobium sp. L103C105A0]
MTAAALEAAPEPDRDCPLCPRLHDFISDWRRREPSWFNAPVPTFLPPDGEDAVELLIVGLAPGLRGANRTGRPFTGDYAGDLLYSTMIAHGFARGEFKARPDDGLELIGTAITNAVRCVPPENKPVGAEISTCRSFLVPTIARFPKLRAVLALGSIAHQSTVRALGQRVAAYPFKHGGRLPAGGVTLFSSYHCSRYNTNTGVLTEAMFVKVFSEIASFLRN